MKLAIVEDSLSIRAHLCALVSQIESISVVAEADSQDEAIAIILELNPDVVILDLHLKSGTGIEVLRQTRKNSYRGKVIVMTNYAFPQYQQKCIELGADHFLDKCKDIGELSGLLNSFIE